MWRGHHTPATGRKAPSVRAAGGVRGGEGPRQAWRLPWLPHRDEPEAEEVAGTGAGRRVGRRGEEALPRRCGGGDEYGEHGEAGGERLAFRFFFLWPQLTA